jgi:hypothetical protein
LTRASALSQAMSGRPELEAAQQSLAGDEVASSWHTTTTPRLEDRRELREATGLVGISMTRPQSPHN